MAAHHENPDQLLTFAVELARSAAAIARESRRSFSAFRKLDGSEVTTVDLIIQETMLERLHERFPDHAVLAEENSPRLEQFPAVGRAPYTWVIDPLDGTRNFVRGLPIHATSIAVMEGPVPVVGVVFQHLFETIFAARSGAPPTANGEAIAVSDRFLSRQSLVGIPSGKNEKTGPVLRNWLDEIVLRNLGSTALHMAYVASGALDGAYCQECHIWDVAAGWLLITTAGGVCTNLKSRPLFPCDPAAMGRGNMPFLAGNRSVHSALLGTLTDTRNTSRDS